MTISLRIFAIPFIAESAEKSFSWSKLIKKTTFKIIYEDGHRYLLSPS